MICFVVPHRTRHQPGRAVAVEANGADANANWRADLASCEHTGQSGVSRFVATHFPHAAPASHGPAVRAGVLTETTLPEA